MIDALFKLAQDNNINVWGVKNFKELKNKILNKDSTKNASFLKDLYKTYNENTNEQNNYLESDFNKFVFEYNLINVIGITTTTSTKINLSDKNGVGVADVEPKDLFTEYPIGVVIIDEISNLLLLKFLQELFWLKKLFFQEITINFLLLVNLNQILLIKFTMGYLNNQFKPIHKVINMMMKRKKMKKVVL
ncbi:hypothetical protein [Mesomycoplasma hyorhinis]|uniref:hypothetical protein n=1 Tax=Mesomycoplasma hyorhinis TaxID=2100 RepID=UPI001F334BA6|nr:hypothetical protein [Mesomycoplasma hyorhinis]